MNRRPVRRRYEAPPPSDLADGDIFVGKIEDPEIAKAFASVVTNFVYLEERMVSVLAVLLGSSDRTVASYIMRSIRSPAARIEVMKELLEKAPINQQLDDDYDDIIREFRSISVERNEYAHGRWWTDFKKQETVLDDTDDPNATLHIRRVVTAAELDALNERMLELHGLIGRGPESELRRREKAYAASLSKRSK